MDVPHHVFREYDIRGIVGRELTPALILEVGRAYGGLLRTMADDAGSDGESLRVVLGQDNRPTSSALADALVQGLNEVGVHVLDLGVVPTPVTWWAEKTQPRVHGALQVTGSHNPVGWNGVKMTALGRSLFGDQVQELRTRVTSGHPPAPEPSSRGDRIDHPTLDAYVDDVVGRIGPVEGVRMVVDCGNGTGAVVAERLLERLGVEVIPLYCESDGTFPNHHPDPTVDEYLTDMIELVRKEGAQVGVAFDGDADRIGMVDDRGRILRGDVLLLLYGLDLLERKGPGQLLLYDVKCSQLLPEVYDAAGGRSLMWKTGHSLMKEKMRETGAPLAGELSGHICFGGEDYLGIDDALYAACRLARMIADRSEPISTTVDGFPTYVSTPEIRLEVTEEVKTLVVAAAAEHFSATHDVVDVDGVRIPFGDGWALIRASNTQPVLVLRFEARNEERLAEIRGQVERWLRGQGIHG